MIATEQTSTEPVTLDGDWQRTLHEYTGQRWRGWLLGFALTVAYTLLWLFSGLAIWLRHVLNSLTANDWLRVAGFSIVFFASLWLLKLPLVYYLRVVLVRRYQMPVRLDDWLADHLKVGLANGIIGGFAIEIIYSGLHDYYGSWWLLGGNVIAASVPLLYKNLLIGYLFYDFHTAQDEQLSAQLAQAGNRWRTEVGNVYPLKVSHRTDAAVAMTSHRNGKPSLVISDTMMQQFTAAEIETTMAHEIGHHLHHDGRWNTLVRETLIIVKISLSLFALYWLIGLVGINSVSDIAAIPLFALLMTIIGALLLPLQSGFSRWREQMADEYALKATGQPQVFTNKMTKFANQSFVEANPDWLTRLTLTHPTYGERIAMAQRYAEELETQDGRWQLN